MTNFISTNILTLIIFVLYYRIYDNKRIDVLLCFFPIIIISLALYTLYAVLLAYKRKEKDCHPKFRQYLLPVYFLFVLISVCVTVHWFLSEGGYIFNNAKIWSILRKGSMEALSSVMGVIGIGSVIISWTFKERDSITLGQPMSEIITYWIGEGYNLSFILHFFCTAAAIVMLNCKAEEPAFWFSFTVLFGCIPHVLVCVRILMDKNQREKIAVELWELKSREPEKAEEVISQMVSYIDDPYVRNNLNYKNSIGKNFGTWISTNFKRDQKKMENDNEPARKQKNVTKVAERFRELAQSVPKEEQADYELAIIKSACNTLAEDYECIEWLCVLCGGYYIYLYTCGEETVRRRLEIMRLYYSVNTETEDFCKFETAFYHAYQWYMFLESTSDSLEYYILCANKGERRMVELYYYAICGAIAEIENKQVNIQNRENSWKQLQPEEDQ